MPKNLHELKQVFNPQAFSSLPVELEAVGATGIPVLEDQVFTGIDNIHIAGDVTLKKGSVVQRGTSIIAEPGRKVIIGEAAPIMDHVQIYAAEGDVFIGNHVTVAHGSHVLSAEGPVHIDHGAFVNINVRIAGGTIEKDGYVGPGVELHAGEVIPEGKIHFNHPHYAISSRIVGDNYEGADTKKIARMNIKDTSGRLPLTDAQGSVLTLEGGHSYEEWTGALNRLSDSQRTRQQNLPFESWLREYSLRQLGKAAAHMANEAQNDGEVVWHAAALQSDILHLSKIRDILSSPEVGQEALAEQVGNLLKAEAFLLGVYNPARGEEKALEKAFVNSGDMLKQVGGVLSTINDPVTILSFLRENAASAATGTSLDGAERMTYVLEKADIARFQERLAAIGARVEEISTIALNGPEAAMNTGMGASEIGQAAALKEQLNPTGANMRQIPDGPHVKLYDGAVPVIAGSAALVGKVDLVGNVYVGENAVLEDTSARTEQRIIPGVIQNDAVVSHAILHTAGREQTPFEVGARAFIHGQPDNKVVLHGPYVGPESYVGEGAVVADEVLLSGVVFPGAVIDGVTAPEKWKNYAGNVCSGSVEMLEEQTPGFTKLPPSLQNLDVLESTASENIAALRKEERERIGGVLQEKVVKYGEIYTQSAHLQAGLLSLQVAEGILASSGKTEHLQNIRILQEGYEYLLGERGVISSSTAMLLVNDSRRENVIGRVQQQLSEVAKTTGEGIEISLWPREGEPGMGREHIRQILFDTIHPGYKEPGQEQRRAEAVEARLPKNAFIPAVEITERIIPNLLKGSKRIASLAAMSNAQEQQGGAGFRAAI